MEKLSGRSRVWPSSLMSSTCKQAISYTCHDHDHQHVRDNVRDNGTKRQPTVHSSINTNSNHFIGIKTQEAKDNATSKNNDNHNIDCETNIDGCVRFDNNEVLSVMYAPETHVFSFIIFLGKSLSDHDYSKKNKREHVNNTENGSH